MIPAAVIAALAFIPLFGCGGGGGGGSGGEEPPPVTVPTILSTTPADGADQVPNDTEIIINFSEAMNPTSVVTGLDIPSHSGTTTAIWQVGNARVDLSFDPLLSEDTHYVVTLDASVLDAEGTSLGAAYSFSFDTGSVPIATINYPAQGETGVGLNPIVSIGFSEPMDTVSFEDNFGVSPYGGTLDLTWGNNGNGIASSVDVSFASSLTVGTTYTASLLPFAEDAQGTQLGEAVQVTFSTGGALATGAISGVIDDDPDSNYDNNLEDTIMALFDHPFFDTGDGQPILANADAGGAYHFSFLSPGNYWLMALQDTNGDGEVGGSSALESGDSIGIWSDIQSRNFDTITVAASPVTGISFELLDTEAISGEVTYIGSDTATAYSSVSTVFVGAFTSKDLSGDPDYGDTSSTDDSDDYDSDTNVWGYSVNAFFQSPSGRMMTGSYYVGAYIDLDEDSNYDPDRNGDGDFDDGEPAGMFLTSVPIIDTGHDAVGIDIVTNDTVMLFGNVNSLTDTTNLEGVPYSGATVSLLDYPLEAASGDSGEFTMAFVPKGINVAPHAEPAGGSSLMPYNGMYMTISDTHAYLGFSDPGADGIQPILLSENVVSFFGDLCSVTVDPTKAVIAGNYNIVDGEVLFASGDVKYVDSQFNCTLTANGGMVDGPSFFIFNADAALFTDNKGDISGSYDSVVYPTETIPVRNGEFTWVELRD
jgi:hypothetical protein